MLTLPEIQKIDNAVKPQSIASTSKTSEYYAVNQFSECLCVLTTGAIAATKTAAIQILQATDRDGSDSKDVDDALATITACSAASKANIALSTVIATDVFTVNGLTFTCVASGATAADREFDVGGSDTLTAVQMAAIVNDSDYGVPGVVATASTSNLILTSETGETSVTISTVDSTMTCSTVEAFAYVSLKANELDTDNDFDHVAIKITTDASILSSAALLRGGSRYGIVQGAAAATVL